MRGYTSFVIASCVATICEAILGDKRSVLPVSTLLSGQHGIEGVYLGLPYVVGRSSASLCYNWRKPGNRHPCLARCAGRTLDATRT